MAEIYAEKAAILQKVESTYGTDSVPVAGTDALMVHNLRIDPLKKAYAPRNPVLPFFGNQGLVVAASWAEISFDIEMAGSGTAGTAPKYAVALKSCGMAETVNAGTDVQYDPITTGISSSSIYYYESGVLHKILGALGNVSFELKAGDVPMMHFRFIGLHVAFADATLITPTLTSFQIPVAANKVNTTPFTLHTFAGIFSDITLDVGNDIQYFNKPNFEGVRFVNRMSKGHITLEKDLVASKDWGSIIKAGTTGALTVTHNTVAGNIGKLDVGQAQLTNYTESVDRGIKLVGMDFEARPTSAGNNEFKFTVK